MTTVQMIGEVTPEVKKFEIKNEEISIIVTNLGAHLLSVFAKDRDGKAEDVILGVENVEDVVIDGGCMGASVGRVANRIKDGYFMLNGKRYELAQNALTNTLHGGEKGFNKQVFDYEILEDGVAFTYVSEDMDQGFPGKLTATFTYRVEGNSFSIEFGAETDADTICNLTNHAYFNLSAGKSQVYNHKLQIKANQIACVDDTCCANGEFLDVVGTPFDFNEFHEIGERIDDDHKQLVLAGGYDHSYILRDEEDLFTLYDPESGRKLVINTTNPCIQIYTGNFLESDIIGKGGVKYKNRDGIAIEPQLLPNSIHIEEEPMVILRPGETYKEKTVYTFEVE